MSLHRTALAAALALATVAVSVAAAPQQQINAGQCIVAGRLNDKQHWAPRFNEVQLLAAQGRAITATDRPSLSDAQQVRITKPALLTDCDGDEEMIRGEQWGPSLDLPVPAVAPGIYPVDSVAFPKLRTGGALVEVKVRVPLDKIVMHRR